MQATPRSRRRLVWGGLALALSLLAVGPGCAALDALGEPPSGERQERVEGSPHYADGRFRNALPTRASGGAGAAWEFLFGGSDHRTPRDPVPVVARTASDFAGPPPPLRVTWLGHSTLLVEVDGARVLVDPVWGEHASPVPIAFGRFYDAPLALEDLPPLDAVAISHNHYDHLDSPTVRALADAVPLWVVPLGVGSHLESWGVPPERIAERDWWGFVDLEGDGGPVRLVATPARHTSGRSLGDRDRTLWSGWAVLGPEHRVWYSGDTALTPEFAEVGARFGPFDVTLVEAGAYNAAWADNHLGPEQAVAAHRMVRGRLMVPVHWALFDLSVHGWTEPAERVRVAAERAGVAVAFPRPGESVEPGAGVPGAAWWPSLPWRTAREAPVASTGLPDSVLALVP